jgi:hypothetical protein
MEYIIALFLIVLIALAYNDRKKGSPSSERPAVENATTIYQPVAQITVIFSKEIDENTNKELADLYLTKRTFFYENLVSDWQQMERNDDDDDKETFFVEDNHVNWNALKNINI